MPDPRGPKVGTLAGLAYERRHLVITCERRGCQHRSWLDTTVLLARFGDVPIEAINQAAVCSRCGGRAFHLQALHDVVPGTREWAER